MTTVVSIDLAKLPQATLLAVVTSGAMLESWAVKGSSTTALRVMRPRVTAKTTTKAGTVAAKPATKTAAKAPRATAARKAGEKRSPEQIAALTEKLHAYVIAHPGNGIEVISKALGHETSELAVCVKRLVAAKNVKTQGVKRATRYFPAGTKKHVNGVAHVEQAAAE